MRVSTRGAFLHGLNMMQRLQSALDHTQRQISSGRRVLTPSDDPIAASRVLELRESLARLDQFDRNANIASNRLAQEESALTSVNDVLQRVRELALQANNASQSDESRALLAVEMRQRLDQLVQLANQQDGDGNYLFSGNLVDTAPVTRMGASFSYNGDQGQRFIRIGEGRQIADGDAGSAVFFAIRDGNGTFSSAAATSNTGSGVLGAGSLVDPTAWVPDQYTLRFIDSTNYELLDSAAGVVTTGTFQPGDTIAFNGIEFSLNGQPQAADEFRIAPSGFQDVFSTLERMIAAVETNATDDASRAAMNNRINTELQNIDQALGRVLSVRTEIGSRLAAVESQLDSNAGFALTHQETLASLEDLDYAEALSRMSVEITTLEAAQQSFVRTQGLSLFSFL